MDLDSFNLRVLGLLQAEELGMWTQHSYGFKVLSRLLKEPGSQAPASADLGVLRRSPHIRSLLTLSGLLLPLGEIGQVNNVLSERTEHSY